MLAIYDRNHDFVCFTFAYSGLCIEEKVDDGDKTLSFNYTYTKRPEDWVVGMEVLYKAFGSGHRLYEGRYSYDLPLYNCVIEPEFYIIYEDQEYVVKQVQGDKITAILNLEWLRAPVYKDVKLEYVGNTGYWEGRVLKTPYFILNPEPAAGPLLDVRNTFINMSGDVKDVYNQSAATTYRSTGWFLQRPVGMAEGSGLDLVYAICAAYMYESVFDTINRKVYFYKRVGTDNGVEFRKGLNLRTVGKKLDSYDFYTVIYPTGKNGLEVVNPDVPGTEYYPDAGGADTSTLIKNNVVTDFSYSRKTRVYYWHDENYTDPELLLSDAKLLLEDMSKPMASYDVKVRDLAAVSDDYSLFAFGLGDVVTIIDPDTDTREKQRITGRKIYPQNRDQDTITLSNTKLTFQEIQAKLSNASKVINSVTNNGKIMLSAIEDITPISGTIAVPSGFTAETNSLHRQLSQVCLNYSLTGTFSPDVGKRIGTVPAGFRPASLVRVTVPTSGGFASVAINEDGGIVIYDGASLSKATFSVTYVTSNAVPSS